MKTQKKINDMKNVNGLGPQYMGMLFQLWGSDYELTSEKYIQANTKNMYLKILLKKHTQKSWMRKQVQVDPQT